MAFHRAALLTLTCVLIGVFCGLMTGLPVSGAARAQAVGPTPTPDFPISLRLQHELRFTPWELVTALTWSPDGETLALSAGNSVYLFEVDGWQQLARIEIGALTHALAFSPDGLWLAAGSQDGKLRLWGAAALLNNGAVAPRQTLAAHRKGVNDVRFSPDGALLASGGNDAIARFWDTASGRLVGVTIGGSFAVPSIDFSPDGKTLAVVNGSVVRLREVGSERISGAFQSKAPLFRVAFSPDGVLLAASGNDNLIRVWKTAEAYRTANPVYPEPLLLTGHSGAAGAYQALIWKIVFSNSGRLLASAGGDGTLRLWDATNGMLLGVCEAHRLGVADIAFRNDEGVIASGGLEGSLKVWAVMDSRANP